MTAAAASIRTVVTTSKTIRGAEREGAGGSGIVIGDVDTLDQEPLRVKIKVARVSEDVI
jgi:hypothetical protein